MFKRIIALTERHIIPRLPSKHRRFSLFGYTFGTPRPEFPGLPADFVGINPDQRLANKVIYDDSGIPTGLRILSGDGIYFKAYTEKYVALENRHFDSFESFQFSHDQIR